MPSPKEAVAVSSTALRRGISRHRTDRAPPSWISLRRRFRVRLYLSGAGRLDDPQLADADRPGVRVGLVNSHASALALRRIVKQAELIGVELPESAFDLLRVRQSRRSGVAARSASRFAARLPGSRALANSYGINRVAHCRSEGPRRIASLFSRVCRRGKDIRPVATHHRARRSGRLRRRSGGNARLIYCVEIVCSTGSQVSCCLATKAWVSSGSHGVHIAADSREFLFHGRIGDDFGHVRADLWR